MKPDYKNWLPKWMIVALAVITMACLIGFTAFGLLGFKVHGTWRWIAGIGLGILFLVCSRLLLWGMKLYKTFSYDGERQLAKQMIEGTASYITLPPDGLGLDIGCGSGALCIACAKRNPQAKMIGLDRWGWEYPSFSKKLCEENAQAEGVFNTAFIQGNAKKLNFPDESFDAVTSNYVYHNIMGSDKQELLLETLRVLKKGGSFAIHDIMSPAYYGDMKAFLKKLKEQGYEKAELIDTTKGMFLSPEETKQLMLQGSTLLVGKK